MIISKTPLRMSWVGGGSDLPAYYREELGAVLSTSIDKYVYIALNPKFDNKIRLNYSKTEEVTSLDEIEHPIVREALKYFDIDYLNKDLIVIGSGATAITLIPSLSEKAKHVTMLQRSPTYLMNLPRKDKFTNFLFRLTSPKFAHFISRWKYIMRQIYFYGI